MTHPIIPNCAVCHNQQDFQDNPLVETRLKYLVHLACAHQVPAPVTSAAEFPHLAGTPSQPAQHLNQVSNSLQHQTNTALGQWISQGKDLKDRHARATLAIQFKTIGITFEDDRLVLQNSLKLENPDGLTGLPEQFKIIGDLEINYGNQISSLGKNIEITGGLRLKGCSALLEVAETLEVHGLVSIQRSTRMSSLAKNLTLHSSLNLERTHYLASLPDSLHIPGSLLLDQCSFLTGLPKGCRIGGQLKIVNCRMLGSLPDSLEVGEDIELEQCPNFQQLPDPLHCNGDLSLRECRAFRHLPRQASIGGDVTLYDCTALGSLPSWIFRLGPRQVNGDTTARLVNLERSGLTQYVLDQIELYRHPDMQFLTGMTHQRNSRYAHKNIYLEAGNEAPVLLDVLNKNPKEQIVVYYKNSDAIDQGGLSRQAFTQAYKSLLKNGQLFSHSEDGLDIAPVYKSPSQTEAAAREFGKIIGRIMLQHMAVGYDFKAEVYEKMAKASQLLQRIPELKNTTYTHAGYIGLCQKTDLVAIEYAVNPERYKTQEQRNYLESLPLEDIRNYIHTGAIAYLGIAGGMQETGLTSVSQVEFIKQRLCGPENLKGFFLEKLHVKISEQIPKELHEKIENWLKTLIQSTTDTELKSLCQEITGASSLYSGQKNISISVGVYQQDSHINTHTCSRTMNINFSFFKDIIENDQYEQFRTLVMQDLNKGFNAV